MSDAPYRYTLARSDKREEISCPVDSLRFASPEIRWRRINLPISANNLQAQKPALPGYYGQSIGRDIISIMMPLDLI
ncbi:hypothetical protein QUB47_21060 [Microcoleus sp. AT9_B5]